MSKTRQASKLPLLTLHWLVLILAVLYLVFGQVFSSRGVYRGLFLNEVLFILVPGILIRRVYFDPAKRGQVILKDLVWTLVAILAAFPIILTVNQAFVSLISGHVDLTNDTSALIRGSGSLGTHIFFLALLPALAEEAFFRGAVQEVYIQNFGLLSVPLSALVFAIFHFDLLSLISPLLIGVILGLIYYTTRSRVLVVLGHAFHNILGISMIYFYRPGFFARLESWPLVGSPLFKRVLGLVLLFLAAYLFLKSLIFLSKGRDIHQPPINIRARDFAPLAILVAVYLVYCLYV